MAKYSAAGNGKWINLAALQVSPSGQLVIKPGVVPFVDFDEYRNQVEYTPQGIRSMFNSKRSISQRFFDDIANILGVKIIMVDVVGNLIRDEIRFKREHPERVAEAMSSQRTIILFEPERGVVEIVGIKTASGLLKIVFADDDPLLNIVRSKS